MRRRGKGNSWLERRSVRVCVGCKSVLNVLLLCFFSCDFVLWGGELSQKKNKV